MSRHCFQFQANKSTRWHEFSYSKRKNAFWKLKISYQIKSDFFFFYSWANFSLQKTLRKGFNSQQMWNSLFSSSGFFCFCCYPPPIFPPHFGKQNWNFFALEWHETSLFFLFFFPFLTPPPQIDYIHAAVLEKRAAFIPMLSNLLLKQNKDIKAMA